jgi:hypothetical protein
MSRDDDYDRPRRVDDDRSDRPARSNGLATAALVLGILSLCVGVCAGIPAVVCGILGLTRASRTGSGKALAITGLALGGIMTIANVVFLPYAVLRVRQAAARSKDSNNFKQVALAVHYHAETNIGRLTSAYARDRDGEPNRGLSWRVEMLPYMDQEALYRQFKRNVPWDDPGNRAAAETVVPQYQSTADPPSDQTRIRVFVGPGTLFEDSADWRSKASLVAIPDGSSLTLMAVESEDTVPWASPRELPYQPGGPLPSLGHPSRSTVLVMMADGSVRSLNKSISPTVLHALITRNGGENLPLNWDQ